MMIICGILNPSMIPNDFAGAGYSIVCANSEFTFQWSTTQAIFYDNAHPSYQEYSLTVSFNVPPFAEWDQVILIAFFSCMCVPQYCFICVYGLIFADTLPL